MSATSAPGRVGALTARLTLLVAVVVSVGLLVGVLFLPAALAVGDVLDAVERDVLDVPPLGDAGALAENSYVYAADGTELAELNYEENRVPVTLDQIPQDVRRAVLATEDADFYEHTGVNHLAIVRAALTNLRSGDIESGASTITQQYVKLAFLTPEQTFARKIQEAVYAIEIERELPKDEILERYLNRAYFGTGVYGIGTAAERYFSKPVEELSLGEGATLAGMLRSPERNNPIASLENATDRRDVVLRQMATHGFVTRAQADAAIAEELEADPSEPPPTENPYWVEWVTRLLTNEQVADALGTQTDALDAMGVTPEDRVRRVFQSGLRIHTTLDPELQELAEASLRDHLTYDGEPADEIALEPTGAIVSVDPETGAIVTLAVGPREYGSCGEDDSWVGTGPLGELLCDRTKVNPAIPGGGGSGRQPGSSFKPFLVAAALEDGVSPTLTLDATGPRRIEGCPDGSSSSWGPVRNSGGDGILDMYEAVKRSSNVYHALLIADIGPEAVVDVAGRLGITSPLAAQCSLSLGAAEVTPLEMASAYATFANRGVHCAPFPIDRIEDADGEVVWQHEPDCEQVVETDVIDRVVDIMSGSVGQGGTAPQANLGAWPTRGKTGTTNDYVDAWFVGYVRQMATAAWIGYENGTLAFETEDAAREVCGSGEDATFRSGDVWICPLPGSERRTLEDVTIAGSYVPRVFGGTIPAPMWADYMRQVVDLRFDPEGFPDPGPLPSAAAPDVLAAGSVAEAERIALEAGFRLRVEEVEHHRSAGTFVQQRPSAGARAPLGSQIVLEVSDGTGVLRVPDVRGLTFSEASQALRAAGYQVARTDTEVDDRDLLRRVLSQSPGAGRELAPGGSVTLEIGVARGTTTPPEDPDEPDEPDDDPEPPDDDPPDDPDDAPPDDE